MLYTVDKNIWMAPTGPREIPESSFIPPIVSPLSVLGANALRMGTVGPRLRRLFFYSHISGKQ